MACYFDDGKYENIHSVKYVTIVIGDFIQYFDSSS
jgi:hypothetical protein